MYPDEYLTSILVISTIAGMEEYARACLRTDMQHLQSFNALALAVQVSEGLGLTSLRLWAIEQCLAKKVLTVEHEAYRHYIIGDSPFIGMNLENSSGHYFAGRKCEHDYLQNNPNEMIKGLGRLLYLTNEPVVSTPLQSITPLILFTGLFKDLIGENGVKYLKNTLYSLSPDQRDVVHFNFYRIKHHFVLGGFPQRV